MGDEGEFWRDVNAHRKALRDKFGVDCDGCKRNHPKRCPTIMLPQQKCLVCGRRDPRPRLTQEQVNSVNSTT